MPINEKRSYTEYVVSSEQSEFTIGFKDYQDDNNFTKDVINVTIDNIDAVTAGYTVTRTSPTVITLSPAVPVTTPNKVVRLQRETNIDSSFHVFTNGAKWDATTMDENFEQVRHSQQEVRDGFTKLVDDVVPVVDGLEEALQQAQDASEAAQAAADSAAAIAANFQSVVSTVDCVSKLNLTIPNNFQVLVKGYHQDLPYGTGLYLWDATKDKALHDGGLVIDPNRIAVGYPTDWTNTSQVAAWYLPSGSGTGCWVKQVQRATIFDYGFIPNNTSVRASNTLAFQQCLDKNIVTYVPTLDMPYYVTAGINIKNGRSILGDNQYMGEPLLADPDRGIIGDGTGAVFTTGQYFPITLINKNRQLLIENLRVRTSGGACLDLFHSDDIVLIDNAFYNTNGPTIRSYFSARGSIRGGHYGSSFATYHPDNFSITLYDNCNAWSISPTTVIAGGTNGGGVDVTQSQKVIIDGVYETNGGFGIRVGGYTGDNLPAWVTGTNYVRGNQVQANTNAWVCMADHTASASFNTDQATKWRIINGNSNSIAINGYIEATNMPVSIGAKNLVLSPSLGRNGLFIGGGNATSPSYHIQLGAVNALSVDGSVSIHRKGSEPTFNFTSPIAGSPIAEVLNNSSIKNIYVQGGTGPTYTHTFSNPALVGRLFGNNELKLSSSSVTSGQVREYISKPITANVAVAITAIVLANSQGGTLDSVEVIDATGTLACTVQVGIPTAINDSTQFDPSTLTYANGAATAPITSTLIRPNEHWCLRVVAGAGTGTFRLRLKYRM